MCIVCMPIIISKSFNTFILVSFLAYLILTVINLLLSVLSIMIKHGAKANQTLNLSYETEYDLDIDRCIWFIPAGPLGTLLIFSNIILNIINKF